MNTVYVQSLDWWQDLNDLSETLIKDWYVCESPKNNKDIEQQYIYILNNNSFINILLLMVNSALFKIYSFANL